MCVKKTTALGFFLENLGGKKRRIFFTVCSFCFILHVIPIEAAWLLTTQIQVVLSIIYRRTRATKRRLHTADNMHNRCHSHRSGRVVHPLSSEETTTSSPSRSPSPPATARTVGIVVVVATPPATRLRGIGRTVRERRQCLMVASLSVIVVTSPPPPPPAIFYS